MNYGPRKSLEIAFSAIELRKEKLTWPQIAARLKVNQRWLKNWVNKAGYTPHNAEELKASPENLARARQLRSEGVCWKLIEREMGIAWKTLQWAICVENRKALDGQ